MARRVSVPPRVRNLRSSGTPVVIPTVARASGVAAASTEDLLEELRKRGAVPPVSDPASSTSIPVVQPPPLSVPTGRSTPKFPDPETYSGDPLALDSFVLQMTMYLQANGYDLNSVQCVAVSSMYLRGKAKEWFTSYYQLTKLGQISALSDWNAFVSALTEAFRPVELKQKYYDEIFALKQGKTDVRQYISSFNSLRSKTPVPLPENTLCYLFTRGLRTEMHQAFAVQQPKTLDEHFKLAVSLSDLTNSVLPPAHKGSSSKTPAGPTKDSGPSKDTVVCEHCKKTGHDAARCWKLHPELGKRFRRRSKKD
jgi:hypothetical protein